MAIVVKLQGGLGNQMFQYAFGKAFSIKHDCKLYFDYSFFDLKEADEDFTPRQFELGILDLDAPKASTYLTTGFFNETILNKILRKSRLPHKKIILERFCGYNKWIDEEGQPAYFDGYWQCERYFENIQELIKQYFRFPTHLVLNSAIIEKINTSNSISVHVRRGDYISSKKSGDFHGTCSLDYYNHAFRIIESKTNNIEYFVFSDDPVWVKENLIQNRNNITLVLHNTGNSSWKDMYLMSLCKHNIIANSSFSWWAAWLNNNINKTVIAPKKWFATYDPKMDTSDLIPSTWTKL